MVAASITDAVDDLALVDFLNNDNSAFERPAATAKGSRQSRVPKLKLELDDVYELPSPTSVMALTPRYHSPATTPSFNDCDFLLQADGGGLLFDVITNEVADSCLLFDRSLNLSDGAPVKKGKQKKRPPPQKREDIFEAAIPPPLSPPPPPSERALRVASPVVAEKEQEKAVEKEKEVEKDKPTMGSIKGGAIRRQINLTEKSKSSFAPIASASPPSLPLHLHGFVVSSGKENERLSSRLSSRPSSRPSSAPPKSSSPTTTRTKLKEALPKYTSSPSPYAAKPKSKPKKKLLLPRKSTNCDPVALRAKYREQERMFKNRR